jgi:SAM-dependent methyltransferase
VLEVGCGTGNYLGAIRESTGCEAFGVDPSPEMLAQLRARALPVRVREGHAEQLDFPAGTFDLVYSVDVIHHVVDRETAYREAARALRPGGVVCTVTDSEWIIRHRTPQSVYFPETIAVELARYPSIEALRSMMVKAGFESPSEEVVEHSYELTDAVAYREKVFSSLLYISDEAFSRGLAKLEADLLRGPVPCTSRYLLLRGNAPGN